jgi:hypothetical protein
MRAFRTLMMAGLLAATGLVQAVPVKKTADFEGLSAPSDPSVIVALPYSENGLSFTGNGAFAFGLGVAGGGTHNALLLSEVSVDQFGDTVDQCPSAGCAITVGFSAGFTNFGFSLASLDLRSGGAPMLEIFGDQGQIGSAVAVAGVQSSSACKVGVCTFQEFSVDLAPGQVGTSFRLSFASAAHWLFDQFNVTPFEATPPNRVPEPASFALVLAALGGVAVTRRRRGQ